MEDRGQAAGGKGLFEVMKWEPGVRKGDSLWGLHKPEQKLCSRKGLRYFNKTLSPICCWKHDIHKQDSKLYLLQAFCFLRASMLHIDMGYIVQHSLKRQIKINTLRSVGKIKLPGTEKDIARKGLEAFKSY